MRVTAQTKAATRQRILNAARTLFTQEGFETATTRDIARQAQIASGTLFNYFPTKEAIVLCLVGDAHAEATAAFWHEGTATGPSMTLEEELFAHIAAGLRRLKPYRKYLSAALEWSLASSTNDGNDKGSSFRTEHLDTVGHIVSRHAQSDAFSPLAVQLYWTLYAGVLSFWANDTSPRQEDTLALLDQSLAMYVGWLVRDAPTSERPGSSRGDGVPGVAAGRESKRRTST